jgi:uncharacterized membrane protein
VKPAHVAAIALIALMGPHVTFAGFRLCNRTSQDRLMVATARTWYAQDQSTGERVTDAESMGWTPIDKGACVVISPWRIRFDDFYFFAYSASNTNLRWTGQYNFCVDPKNTFDYPGRSRALVPCLAGMPVGMIFVDTYGDDDYQFSIFDQR